MKTTSWTPSPTTLMQEFTFDDSAIFSSSATRSDESATLLAALLAGARYAAMGHPFQIFTTTRDELVRFVPGTPVMGVPVLCQALRHIAAHMDLHVDDTHNVRMESVKANVLANMSAQVDAAVQELLPMLEARIREQIAAEAAGVPVAGAGPGADAAAPDTPQA